MERLSLGLLPLPATLKTLKINDSVAKRVLNNHGRMVWVREHPIRTCMTRRALHRSACDLAKLYPSLKNICFAQSIDMWSIEDGEGSWRLGWDAVLPDLHEQANPRFYASLN